MLKHIKQNSQLKLFIYIITDKVDKTNIIYITCKTVITFLML